MTPQECIRKAEECERQTRDCISDIDRGMLLTAAEEWRNLAKAPKTFLPRSNGKAAPEK